MNGPEKVMPRQPIGHSALPVNIPASPVEPPAPPQAVAEPQVAVDEAPGPDTDEPRSQRARVPFGRQETKLSWPPIPGYVLRWFNDNPGRIERAQLAGYEHVLDREKRPVSRTVGTAERGGGLNAYLMKIPEEFYNEDFAAKQAVNDEIDQALYRGMVDQQSGDHRYVPKGGIKINASHRRPT